jgi:hypothetical protein
VAREVGGRLRGGLRAQTPVRSDAWQRLFVAHRDRCHCYLEHGDQLPPTRLCFNPRRHDPFSSVYEHDNVTGLEIGRGVLESPKSSPVVSWRR